jgi:hypothetical protein
LPQRNAQPRRVELGNCCSIHLSYGGIRVYEAIGSEFSTVGPPYPVLLWA